MKNKGFTIAEVLVTVVIIGVISLLLITTIKDNQQNQEMIMFKKAYGTVSRIVMELVNDNKLYPDDTDESRVMYRNLYSGLSNTEQVTFHNENFGGAEGSEAAKYKFCNLFVSKLNTTGDIVCEKVSGNDIGTSNELRQEDPQDCQSIADEWGLDINLPAWYLRQNGDDGGAELAACKEHNENLPWTSDLTISDNPNFKTVDGMSWWLPYGNFHAGRTESSTCILVVDINGEHGNNCHHGDNNCTNPDRFNIYIDRDGSVWVSDALEKYYLKETNTTKLYKNIKSQLN